ncbi:MAG: Nif3-like dinuclear metal center hexameric protein [Spirochaetaceae bacterium]|nr:Nif3-like dinuclear metal center hexameric protein [Spirochaetaceae bacterium]
MNLMQLDEYFRSFLDFESFATDYSLNGIQVENSNPFEKPIERVAFAVDACTETIARAAKAKADLLFVHHGLFWGQCQRITGSHYQRIKAMVNQDIALYACHLPLDANTQVGNNYGIARRLGLEQIVPFGLWKGLCIGAAGVLPKALNVNQLTKKLLPNGEQPLGILPFGKREIRSVAIVSGGGGSDELEQAISEGYDAFITGEIKHELYHTAMEAGICVIAGGHYQTETVGVQLVMEKLTAEKGLDTIFIDVPTGL